MNYGLFLSNVPVAGILLAAFFNLIGKRDSAVGLISSFC